MFSWVRWLLFGTTYQKPKEEPKPDGIIRDDIFPPVGPAPPMPPMQPPRIPDDGLSDSIVGIGEPDMSDRQSIQNMIPSQKCVDLVKHFESFKDKAYVCPGGVLTIGYGHTSSAGPPDVREADMMTEMQASNVLHDDLIRDCDRVKTYVQVPLTQYEFDALVSFCFNVGSGAFGNSTLLKKLNDKIYDEIDYEMSMWNKAQGQVLPGLVRRRKSEGHLFDTGELEFFDG